VDLIFDAEEELEKFENCFNGVFGFDIGEEEEILINSEVTGEFLVEELFVNFVTGRRNG
jgi:hypothetical protein